MRTTYSNATLINAMIAENYFTIEYRKGKYLLLLHHFIIVAFLVCALFYSFKPASAGKLIYLLSTMIVAIFIWCFWSWYKTTHSILDPYTLFLASAFLFLGSPALLHIFGYGFEDLLGVNFPADLLATSLYYTAISIATFHYGSLLAVNIGKQKRLPESKMRSDELAERSIRTIGSVLLAISLPAYIYLLREQLLVVGESAYQGLFQREAATGFGAWPSVISGFLIPGTFFILIGGRNKRATKITAAVIMSFYCILNLYIGSRNRAILPLVVFFWLWSKYVARFKKIAIIVIVIALIVVTFFIFPLVKSYRAIAGKERANLDIYLESWRSVKNPWLEPFREMGGSFRTVPYAISLIPSDRAYDYGASYLYSALTILPNFFWEVHPTIMRGTLADWLVDKVNPYIAARGGGYGFSFVAESYANFGWYGLLVMLILGLFLGYFTLRVTDVDNPFILIFVACFMPQAMFFVRGESALLVRSIAWYALLPTAVAFMLYKLMKKYRHS